MGKSDAEAAQVLGSVIERCSLCGREGDMLDWGAEPVERPGERAVWFRGRYWVPWALCSRCAAQVDRMSYSARSGLLAALTGSLEAMA